MTKATQCVIHAEDLHPTQFAVGMRMVKKKTDKLEKMSKEERRKFLKEHPVPVIIGPANTFYLTDHYHLARAVLESGHSKSLLPGFTPHNSF